MTESPPHRRLDIELVARGLARSRGDARELVDSGAITVDGVRRPKASTPVTSSSVITADVQHRWVGRAAGKLHDALERFTDPAVADPPLQVEGRRCLDVGASTGGFTQVLLEAGAAHVIALDVGHDQLVPVLAEDPRVTDMPRTNIRDVTPDAVGRIDLLVSDLSFIALSSVMDRLAALVHDTSDLVVLVKPQFEVGREALSKHGVVRSAKDRAAAVRQVLTAALDVGLNVRGLEPSSVIGGRGNREYVLWMTPWARGKMDDDELTERIEAITKEGT